MTLARGSGMWRRWRLGKLGGDLVVVVVVVVGASSLVFLPVHLPTQPGGALVAGGGSRGL